MSASMSASVKKVKTDRKTYMREYQARKYKENSKLLNETRLLNKYKQDDKISKTEFDDYKTKYNNDELFMFCKSKILLDKFYKENPIIFKKIMDDLVKHYLGII